VWRLGTPQEGRLNMGTNPREEQLHFAQEAVRYRELYYQGQDEAIATYGEVEGPIVWAESKLGKQYAATNKWHMQQADMFGSLAQTSYLKALMTEMRVQSQLLQDIKTLLEKDRT
jgi:hypothetical protein